MKRFKITLILVLLVHIWGYSQTVSAPEPKSFTQSTNGQDGSGFVLSGFGSTETLLASISLINPPTNTTFNLITTTGLSAASGFTLSGNKVRLVVTGTMANINNTLSSLKVNTGSVIGNVQLSVAATVNPVGFFYNGVNGHFYRPISTGTTYTNARAASLLTTFKGQKGYLVTITSASENAFIYSNVPQANIWFAATDEVVDGRWVIDAGPEKGTVIKTSNLNSGNVVGQYNNWAGGEPNGYNGSENYAVTNWGGQSTWNDLSNNWNNPYIIEYGTWTNPDDQTFTDFFANSVIHSNGEVLRAQFNFEFGSSIDETRFNTKLLAQTNNQFSPTTNVVRNLNGLGRVDMTSDLDANKVLGDGFRTLTTPGQVEWAIIDVFSTSFGGHRLYIDSREFDGTGISPSSVNSIKLFDIYDGPITYTQDAGSWKIFRIVPNISSKILSSTFQQYLRLQNGWYGTKAEFTFEQSQSYKPHGIELNTTNVGTLYNNVVTVSDVFLAFKELANGGLFGNESGNEFSSGVQFMNADIDGNGVFDERDTYKLIQHLVGEEIIGNGSTNLSDYMKILPKSEYDGVTKSNWNLKPNLTSNIYSPINLSNTTLLNNFTYSVFWKGDVNMSHSSGQTNSNLRVQNLNEIHAFLMSEILIDKLVVSISLDPLNEIVVGTQFQLNYDNTKLKFKEVEFTTKGNPINYGTNRGSFINIGSLISSGMGSLDKTTEYRIIFELINPKTDILGLTSISETDAVNTDGKQLKIKIK